MTLFLKFYKYHNQNLTLIQGYVGKKKKKLVSLVLPLEQTLFKLMVTLESFHKFWISLTYPFDISLSLSLFIGLLAMALVAKRELVCFFLMMMIMAFSGACMAATYNVGDSAGWTIQIPVDYTKWSSSNNFHVGDKIGELPLFLSRLFGFGMCKTMS